VIVDLVRTTTRDGVRLDGSMQSPSGSGLESSLAVDAVLCVHGTGGSFYSSSLFDGFGESLLARGCAVLRVNTRGHDGISTAATAQGGRRVGAAYETVDDCRHDLAAWIDWLAARGLERIGLLGHSLGAVKSIYALAHEAHPAVTHLIAISPPRLSYSAFCASAQAGQFLETFQAAQQHVRTGRPDTLMEVKLPLPFVITAAGYVEKYGPDERYNLEKFLMRVPCPVLITFGSIELEHNMAFRGVPEALVASSKEKHSIDVLVINGADHFYAGVLPELVARAEVWLRPGTQ
jgi:pimeloyl-ACP methyl ester carboxylesterase